MAQAGAVRRSVLAVAHNPALVRLETAYGLFAVYEMGLWVVVLLWAYQVGGPTFAGLVSVLQLVPAALLAPVGGVIADRMRRDLVLRGGYLAHAASMGLLAALLAVEAPRSAVVASATLWCVLVAWTRPAHYAAAAELSRTPADAAAANSLSGTLQGAGYFLGPVLAGVSASLGGPSSAVTMFAVVAVVCALLLTGVRLGAPTEVPVEGAPTTTARLTTELVRQPSVAIILLVVGLEFVAEGSLQLLAIAFVNEHLDEGEAVAGLLIGASGLGGILGAAGAIVLVRWKRMSLAVVGSLAAGSVPMLAFTVITSLFPAVVLLVLVGAGMAFFGVAGITLLQRAVSNALMARIMALRESAFLGGFAAGAVVAPVLIEGFGASVAYAVLGAGLTVLALAAWPAARRLEAASTYRPQVVALLQGIGFLAVLDAPVLERLAHGATLTTAAPGDVVIRQGEPGESYYVVETGAVTVSFAQLPATERLGPGSGFGEIALLRQVPRAATVRAETDCRLWRIDRDLFLASVAGSAGHDIAERHIDEQLHRSSRPPDR